MTDPNPAHIVAITAATDPLSGIDQITFEYEDGTRHTLPGTWTVAREMALKAGLEHAEYEPGGTVWTKR